MKWTTRWIYDVVVNVKLNTFRSQLSAKRLWILFCSRIQENENFCLWIIFFSKKYGFYWRWRVSNNFFFFLVRIHSAIVAAAAEFLLSKKKIVKIFHTHTRNLNFMRIICFRMPRNCVVNWMQMERKLIKIIFLLLLNVDVNVVVFNFPRRKKIDIDHFPSCAHTKHMLTDARIHQLRCLQSIGECARNGWGNLKIDNNVQIRWAMKMRSIDLENI